MSIQTGNIFVVTVMEEGGKSPRSVGWLPTIDAALEAVRTDAGHMSSCRYSYALIEETGAGIYSISDKQWWFEWRDESLQPIGTPEDEAKPTWATGIVNWGLG